MTSDDIVQTDCSKCIYKYNIIPKKIGNKGYTVDGFGWTSFGGNDTPENISRDRCRLSLRMTRPICPMFDDGTDVKYGSTNCHDCEYHNLEYTGETIPYKDGCTQNCDMKTNNCNRFKAKW